MAAHTVKVDLASAPAWVPIECPVECSVCGSHHNLYACYVCARRFCARHLDSAHHACEIEFEQPTPPANAPLTERAPPSPERCPWPA